MLNRLQRILLILGAVVAMVAVMLFAAVIQRTQQQAQATRQALQQIENKIFIYESFEVDSPNAFGFATMFEDTYTALAESLDGEMIYTPIVDEFQEVSITASTGIDVRPEAMLIGADATYEQVANATLLQGDFFSAEDVRLARPVCVVSQSFLDYNGLSFTPGMWLDIGGTQVSVSGVIVFPEGNLQGYETLRYVPLNGQLVVFPYTLRSVVLGEETNRLMLDFIVGQPADGAKGRPINDTMSFLNAEFSENQALQSSMAASGNRIMVVSEAEFYLRGTAGNETIVTVGVFVAVLLLAVAAINIVQLVIAAIADNGQKIALKIALGARVQDIGGELLWELLIINLKGGYIGLTLSGILVALTNHYLGFHLLSFDAWSLLLGLAGTIALTLISMILPLLRLARLQPAQAIREGSL